MTHPQLLRVRDHLGALKLFTAQEITSADFLARLLTDEMAANGEKAVAMRTVMARASPAAKPWSASTMAFNPPLIARTSRIWPRGASWHTAKISCSSVRQGPNNNPSGHWAGPEAVQQGHRTLFTAALSRIATLTKAFAENRFEDRLKRYPVLKLLIIAEMGDIPIDRHGAHLCFQLISRRDERGAIILTANQSFGQWAEVFGDPIVATAILNRLLHHSHVIKMKGDAHRLREKQKAGANKGP